MLFPLIAVKKNNLIRVSGISFLNVLELLLNAFTLAMLAMSLPSNAWIVWVVLGESANHVSMAAMIILFLRLLDEYGGRRSS